MHENAPNTQISEAIPKKQKKKKANWTDSTDDRIIVTH